MLNVLRVGAQKILNKKTLLSVISVFVVSLENQQKQVWEYHNVPHAQLDPTEWQKKLSAVYAMPTRTPIRADRSAAKIVMLRKSPTAARHSVLSVMLENT